MTTNVAIVIILENRGIDPDWKVNNDRTGPSAFEYLEACILEALDFMED